MKDNLLRKAIVSTQLNLNIEIVKEEELAYPPLAEQEEIARHLDDKCSQVEGVIAQKEAIIVKLNDYKKSLIYECVTGKKKVPTLWTTSCLKKTLNSV